MGWGGGGYLAMLAHIYTSHKHPTPSATHGCFWSFFQIYLSNEQNPGWLGHIGDYTKTTQLYRDYFINHYKDPYKPTPVFFRGSSFSSERKVATLKTWPRHNRALLLFVDGVFFLMCHLARCCNKTYVRMDPWGS